ncbi:nucleoside triphosphate pyrophosphohydrolase [Gloeocapsa sp. PCC 73106]|uniref:nucleoside triphosphate pyrophosphohydrolase n=1 Tax=Gloeocapsa sp. PCC 73106 TaxID=102232 RepID=UPI0002ABBA63|nr:nucleoside triphosphate pyrophosphohydrolase [Gloeocapsa sp. PCC 73106]ELR98428.1 MazG family protein [Gloeocapsa sp. PCC 73106]
MFEQTYQMIMAALEDLIKVVAQLRSPEGGCPWDLAQTPQTLIPYVIEEAYEVAEALRSENKEAIVEELGDLLLQVVLQAQIASDRGDFSLQEVAKGITAKLIRRHPHVFGDIEVNSTEEVRENWEKIKAQEKGETTTQLLSYQLKRYLRSLPPLVASEKISSKAAKAGFEWENIEGVWEKFHEEFHEFKAALATENKEHQQAELGDLLFTLTNIARWYELDCTEALQGTNRRFIDRFTLMETFADRPLCEYTLDELETLWKRAKAELAKP